MKPADRVEFFRRLRSVLPHPRTELEYHTPFELLVAVILSAQATDAGVNKATRRLYPLANTPQAFLELGPEGLKEYIRTIGLFNTKAENIIKTCRILVDRHGGEVPRDRESLEALPGVGRKTANVSCTADIPARRASRPVPSASCATSAVSNTRRRCNNPGWLPVSCTESCRFPVTTRKRAITRRGQSPRPNQTLEVLCNG